MTGRRDETGERIPADANTSPLIGCTCQRARSARSGLAAWWGLRPSGDSPCPLFLSLSLSLSCVCLYSVYFVSQHSTTDTHNTITLYYIDFSCLWMLILNSTVLLNHDSACMTHGTPDKICDKIASFMKGLWTASLFGRPTCMALYMAVIAL